MGIRSNIFGFNFKLEPWNPMGKWYTTRPAHPLVLRDLVEMWGQGGQHPAILEGNQPQALPWLKGGPHLWEAGYPFFLWETERDGCDFHSTCKVGWHTFRSYPRLKKPMFLSRPPVPWVPWGQDLRSHGERLWFGVQEWQLWKFEETEGQGIGGASSKRADPGGVCRERPRDFWVFLCFYPLVI